MIIETRGARSYVGGWLSFVMKKDNKMKTYIISSSTDEFDTPTEIVDTILPGVYKTSCAWP